MSTDPDHQDTLDHIALELNSTAIHLTRSMRRIDDQTGVGRAQLSALSVLVFGGPCTLGDLASAEGVTPATIHHVVAGLIEAGLVRKKQDLDDRRKFIISPTRKGRALMMRARDARIGSIRKMMGDLDQKDLEALATAVKILRQWETARSPSGQD